MYPKLCQLAPIRQIEAPGVHILSSMQQLAHGSDSTLYFQWRQSRGNSEKFHGAVVSHDDSTNNRVFKEVAEYGARLEKSVKSKEPLARKKWRFSLTGKAIGR